MLDYAMSGAAGRNARRRSVNLSIERSLQLELPAAFLLLGCAVAVGLAALARSSYGELFAALERLSAPPALEALLRTQTGDFLIALIGIGVLYALALTFLTLIWCHRLVGPVIAFRRMLAALLAGDASARVRLRRGSAFAELADDLNALAERIAAEQARRPT
jgi:hypothetical protein